MIEHALVQHFEKGTSLFQQQQFEAALHEFRRCTQLMPQVLEAWENVAVCMAHLGRTKEEITVEIVPKLATQHQAHMLQVIQRLHTVQSDKLGYMRKISVMDIAGAIDDFSELLQRGSVGDQESIVFLRQVFIAHESLAKRKGLMHLSAELNAWVESPAMKHCLGIATEKTNQLIAQHKSGHLTSPKQQDIDLLETIALVHYTYGNYKNAAIAFQCLYALSAEDDKKKGYQQHLSTCYSLDGNYKDALLLDADNLTAWERYQPCAAGAFRARQLQLIRHAASIGRHSLPYWPANLIDYTDDEITIAKLVDVMVCGQDPMVCDQDFVYVGNRGNSRQAKPASTVDQTVACGVVVYATNSNNYFHLLVEFLAKLLVADQHLPADIPIYIAADDVAFQQQWLTYLNMTRPVHCFSPYVTLGFETLYVVDVRQPGHVLSAPANVWDCYLSQPPSLQRLRRTVMADVEVTRPSKHFVYIRRQGSVRSFVDPDDLLLELLQDWSRKQGMSFVVFDGKEDIKEQVQLFSQAAMLFGIHGAGFTNIMFTPKQCLAVEIPIHNNANPLFQEMSAMLHRGHYICDLSCDYLGTITITSELLQKISGELELAHKKYLQGMAALEQ